jgi:hypothetical protein
MRWRQAAISHRHDFLKRKPTLSPLETPSDLYVSHPKSCKVSYQNERNLEATSDQFVSRLFKKIPGLSNVHHSGY